MLNTLYLMQQTFDQAEAVKYSIGLVIVCLLVLMALWLPGILKEKWTHLSIAINHEFLTVLYRYFDSLWS